MNGGEGGNPGVRGGEGRGVVVEGGCGVGGWEFLQGRGNGISCRRGKSLHVCIK